MSYLLGTDLTFCVRRDDDAAVLLDYDESDDEAH